MQAVLDAWRAFLVVLVVVALREPKAVQSYTPSVQSQWSPQAPVVVNAEPQPIRRVGRAFVELAESFLGVIR
jgi:hypothetical protein